MNRVIDFIQFDERVIENLPDWNFGPGLLVTIDAKHPEGRAFIDPGSTVRIHRPDGTFIDCIVKAIAIQDPGSNVGLFFQNLNRHEIPISSYIQNIQIMPAVLPEV